jgi:hypothetical protein
MLIEGISFAGTAGFDALGTGDDAAVPGGVPGVGLIGGDLSIGVWTPGSEFVSSVLDVIAVTLLPPGLTGVANNCFWEVGGAIFSRKA